MGEELRLPVRELAAAITAGKISASSVMSACLREIDAREHSLAAWTHVMRTTPTWVGAAGDSPAPLSGIPVGVKDNIDTADMPTAYGSAAYEGFRPAADAACVSLLRAAGAVILGKTVTAEFALSSPGPTRNPLNEAHTPGGSSSGSAAAVAAGMALLALGTQTGGSIIRPATYCGIVGYKPSFGLIDRTGVKPLVESLDTVGVLTRSVGDATFFASILARRDLGATFGDVLRVGRYGVESWDKLSATAQDALWQASRAFEQAGATVIDLPLHPEHDEVHPTFSTIVLWEVAASLAFERQQHWGLLRAETQKVLGLETPTPAEYDAAIAQVIGWRSSLDALFGGCDVLLAPAVPDVAPEGIAHPGDPSYCVPWSLLHTPSLAVPVHIGPHGLPMGVQLVGRIRDDARLLAAGRMLEAALQAVHAQVEVAS